LIDRECDVLVIGAGAAGLLAAARCAELGADTGLNVLLIEKGRRPGVKILMSGGTRCNLTQACDRRGIVAAFGQQGRFLHSALAALGPAELVALVEAEGVPTKVESTGKVFPESNKAADILDAFVRRLERSGCQYAPEQPVQELHPLETGGFEVLTSTLRIQAKRVLVTTGGQSYPGCGTTGDGYAWARTLGHTIISPRPSLVPITTRADWVKSLMGVTLPDVRVRVLDGDRKLAESRDGFLFAHFGLTGPSILDVSREVTGHAEPQRLQLLCDLLPDVTADSLDAELRGRAGREGRRQCSTLLADTVRELSPQTALPQRLIETLIEVAGVSPTRVGAELSREDRKRLVQGIKELRIPVRGTLGFEKAEVTAGGVALAEVDSRTMESQLVPGLYFAGEILDLDGRIGGYNFQAAFSTGWLAGTCVAKSLAMSE